MSPSFVVCLTENVGLSERQEGCGLFSESGWSDAVMQVTLQTVAALGLKQMHLQCIHTAAGLVKGRVTLCGLKLSIFS